LAPLALALAAFAVFAGGAVKGVAALGLPLVAIPLATLIVGLKQAVALMVVPMIGANLVQSFQGGLFGRSLRQFRVLAPTVFVFTLIGTRILVAVPQRVLELALGSALIVLPLILHFWPHLRVRPAQRRWGDPLVGAVAGLLGGIAAYYGPPLMIYVLGLRLPKEEFVAGISLLYWIAALGIFVGVYGWGAAGLPLLGYSVLMLLPAGAGLWLGQRVQLGLSEAAFARVLIAVYLATGVTFLVAAAA
jgi:uncharacterized membrane protein YfcA